MLFDPSGSFRPNISVPEGTYQPALRDGPIARVENPLIVPESADEQEGQVDQVVFAEGLVQYKARRPALSISIDPLLIVSISNIRDDGSSTMAQAILSLL